MIASHYVYWVLFAIMMTGLYIVISHGNLIKKLIGLSVFQVGIFLFFISLGKVTGGTAPIIGDGRQTYSNPLPQVLILTAIVVGVATLAVGLALGVRIFEAYGTVEEDDVVKRDAFELAQVEATVDDEDADADDGVDETVAER